MKLKTQAGASSEMGSLLRGYQHHLPLWKYHYCNRLVRFLRRDINSLCACIYLHTCMLIYMDTYVCTTPCPFVISTHFLLFVYVRLGTTIYQSMMDPLVVCVPQEFSSVGLDRASIPNLLTRSTCVSCVSSHRFRACAPQESSPFLDSDPAAVIAAALKRTPGAGRERVIDPDNLTSPACAPEAYGRPAEGGDVRSPNPITGRPSCHQQRAAAGTENNRNTEV